MTPEHLISETLTPQPRASEPDSPDTTRRERSLRSADPAGLRVRLAVVLAAAVCAAVGAPTALTGVLAALAFAVVVESVMVRWSMGAVDGVLLAAGGLLVGVVLLGMVLDVMPGGIDRVGWAIGAGAIESAIVLHVRPARPDLSRLRDQRLAGYGWYAAGLALVVVGLVASVTAEHHSQAAPVALSVQSASASSTALEITSSRPAGPFSLVAGSGSAARVLQSGITVSAGHPVIVQAPTSAGQRITIRLVQGPSAAGVEIRRVILQAP